MSELIPTMPGDMGGGGGPTQAAPDVTPTPGPEAGTPAGAPDTPPLPSGGDQGDPGKGGAPAQASDTPPLAPSAPAVPSGPSPEVQAMQGQIEQLTNLLGSLMHQQQPAAPAAPVRDFAGEKAALDEAFKTEKLDAPAYMSKVGQLAMDQAKAEALAASSAGTATTVEQVQAELKKAQDAGNWKALCAENDGLADFAKSPEFARIKAANPLHDPLSAFLTNRIATLEAKHGQDLKDAVAAKEKEMVEAIKAKGHAAVLGNPGGQPPAGGVNWDERLKNADKYGGRNAVIAEKLAAQRRAAGR